MRVEYCVDFSVVFHVFVCVLIGDKWSFYDRKFLTGETDRQTETQRNRDKERQRHREGR